MDLAIKNLHFFIFKRVSFTQCENWPKKENIRLQTSWNNYKLHNRYYHSFVGYIVCSQKVLVFNTSKKVTAAAFKMRYSHESLTKRRCAFFLSFFSFRNSSIQNGLNFILMDIYYLVFCVFMYFRNIFMILSFIQKLKQLHRL